MKRTLVLFLLCVTSKFLSAQNYPLYSGYFLNPFIYNPAAAATERLQINAGYRRQWLEIPNAPSVGTLTVNTLINDSRAGVGLKVSSFSRGFLNSTEFSLAYAYGVPLTTTSKLFFGISGGVVSNSVNLNDVAVINDPALGSLASTLTPSISFGMLYKNDNGINLGVSLPKLVSSQDLSANYSYTFSDNLIVSASFSKWDPAPKFVKGKSTKSYGKKRKTTEMPLEIFSLYRYSNYGGIIEATAKYNFNKAIWLSASYRQNQGFIPGLGINVDNVSFSYFYEPGIGGDLPLKTHEVLLTVRLGNNKKYRGKEPEETISKTNGPKQTTPIAKATPKTTPVKPPPQSVKKEVVNAPVVKKEVPVSAKVTTPTPVRKDSVKTVKTDPEAAKHQPRFTQKISPVEDVVKTDSTSLKHEQERQELDKHIEEHAEGKHDDTHNEPVNQRHDFVKRGTHHEELEVGTYVIAGAFQGRANADHYASTLKKLGYKADFGHLSVRNLWYVFIAEEIQISDAKNERDRLQKNKIFSKVWLLTVQE